MMQLPRWKSSPMMALQSSAKSQPATTLNLFMELLQKSLVELPLWYAAAIMVIKSVLTILIPLVQIARTVSNQRFAELGQKPKRQHAYYTLIQYNVTTV